jgi:subfamily B ATP-binding cassette protein MsbA
MKAVKTNELTSPLMETLGAIAFGTVILVGGHLFQKNSFLYSK